MNNRNNQKKGAKKFRWYDPISGKMYEFEMDETPEEMAERLFKKHEEERWRVTPIKKD